MLRFKVYEFVLVVSALFIVSDANSQECGLSRSNASEEGIAANASEGSWPWMVAITREGKERRIVCSGFLIDEIHVLSAASCFDNLGIKAEQLSALIGSVNQDETEIYPVDNIIKHHGYKSGQYHDDLAIVKLTVRVGLPKFNPVCLPDETMRQFSVTGSKATQIGWGMNSRRPSKFLKQLRGIKIISNTECTNKFVTVQDARQAFPRGMDNKILCGMVRGKTYNCVGESGAPLMVLMEDRWFAVGVTSFGYRCGEIEFPEGFTRISAYLSWIRRNTGGKRN